MASRVPTGSSTADIARATFDTVDALGKVTTIAELDAIADSAFGLIGFDHYVGYNTVAADGQPVIAKIFGKTHEAWEQHYVAHGYGHHDAMIRAALEGMEPFFWSEVPKVTPITAPEERVLNEAGDFRLREGFVTPFRNFDGSFSAVVLAGQHVDCNDPDVRASARLLSSCFAGAARRLHRQAAQRRDNIKLTPRQRECLQWVRLGKSATDIGDILNISADTVHEHVMAACARLGVRTRVQAVAEAAIRGLIHL